MNASNTGRLYTNKLIVKKKMRINLKLSLWFLACIETTIYYSLPVVLASNPKFVSLDDGIIESSVKNGETQYAIINHDAHMPR